MRNINGSLLIAIGILHCIVGVIGGLDYLGEIGQAGFFDSIGSEYPRIAVFWFMFSGFLLILFGQLARSVERSQRRQLPQFVGWELLVISIIGAILIPISGFWLLMALAINIIIAAKRAASVSSEGS